MRGSPILYMEISDTFFETSLFTKCVFCGAAPTAALKYQSDHSDRPEIRSVKPPQNLHMLSVDRVDCRHFAYICISLTSKLYFLCFKVIEKGRNNLWDCQNCTRKNAKLNCKSAKCHRKNALFFGIGWKKKKWLLAF